MGGYNPDKFTGELEWHALSSEDYWSIVFQGLKVCSRRQSCDNIHTCEELLMYYSRAVRRLGPMLSPTHLPMRSSTVAHRSLRAPSLPFSVCLCICVWLVTVVMWITFLVCIFVLLWRNNFSHKSGLYL